ncbi:hypothetical protein BX661DRAFT_189514 [Kickxella alabastrina]|uniref:uncharacterized protein n=1 Tax=Kickxella alabastrina TaxID=61397 RepID=UPI00221E447A|nr:uncharacterized protein BX661DRAFT_189514 [Kickxella alabastrina]KAI7820104.1 hypothetical protein BX661DRAFT_189514 [Kickxella alabastrina]
MQKEEKRLLVCLVSRLLLFYFLLSISPTLPAASPSSGRNKWTERSARVPLNCYYFGNVMLLCISQNAAIELYLALLNGLADATVAKKRLRSGQPTEIIINK